MTTAALPEALSDAAREFAAGPHRLLIGGDRPEAAGGATFDTVDPSTGQVIAEVAEAGPDDIDRAVKAARAAFEGKWAKLPAAGRTQLMLKLADLVEQRSQELAELESLDNGKPV